MKYLADLPIDKYVNLERDALQSILVETAVGVRQRKENQKKSFRIWNSVRKDQNRMLYFFKTKLN
jgi:hypothetical protein